MRIISGLWKGHRLRGPGRSGALRPTTDRVREAWMSAVGSLDGALVLDLFSGSGALGLEALSRGAEFAVFVERSHRAVAILRSNVERLKATERSAVVKADVFKYLAGARGPFDIRLSSAPGPFDVAFADPPYRGTEVERLIERYQDRPFSRELWIEHSHRRELQLPEGARTRRYGDCALSVITAGEVLA